MAGGSTIPTPVAPSSTNTETRSGDSDTAGQERTYNLLIV